MLVVEAERVEIMARSLAGNRTAIFSWKWDKAEAIERAQRLAAAVQEDVYVLLEGTEPTEYATAYHDSIDEGFHQGSPILAICHPNGEIE